MTVRLFAKANTAAEETSDLLRKPTFGHPPFHLLRLLPLLFYQHLKQFLRVPEGPAQTAFCVSKNEVAFSQQHDRRYYLYRV